MPPKNPPGFTLIELILVVAIVVSVTAIAFAAVNPGKQLAKTRNVERRQEVNSILDAVYNYAAANNGNLPNGITTTQTEICRSE